MQEVGHAALAIIPSFKGFQGDLERGSSKAMLAAGNSGGTQFGDAAGKSAGSRFGSVFKTAAKASLVGLGALTAGAIKVGVDSIGEASDLNESLNAVNLSYERQAKAVKKLGREAAVGLGLSNSEFNSLAVRFSSFSKTIAGGEGPKVTKTLDDLTTRASDFASVMNLEVNEAAQLFQSGLAGETEPLRAYGLDLSAAKVEAFALSTGIVKNKDDLTESAKVQARYALLMKDTSQTQGDFAGTSDELANSQRILGARWDNAQAKLGKGLLPIMKDAVGFVNKEGIPAFLDFANFFTEKGIPAIKDFGDDAVKVAKKVKPLVDLFADLPTGGKLAALGGALGGGFVIKHQIGKLFERGSIANPMIVTVTNPGGGVTPDGKPKPGSPGIGPGTAATLAAIGLPLLDDQYKNNPLLTKSGDWAERMGNKLGLPNWFEGNNGGDLGMSKPPTADWKGIFDGTNTGGGKTSPDLERLAKGFERAGDKAWGAAKMVDGFTGATRDGKRETDRLRDSIDKLGQARVRPEVDTSSIQAALALFRQLPSMAGVVGPVDPRLLSPRAGVTFTGPINVKSNTPREFASGVDKVTRDRSRGGR